MNGCFVGALSASASDRIPLCAYTDATFQTTGHNTIRQQEQRILERLRLPTNQNGEVVGNQYQSFDNKDVMFFVFIDAATDLAILVAVNKLLLRNSSDSAATNQLACTVLDHIFSEFTAAYTAEQIGAKTVRTYQFIKFDTAIQKLIARVVQQDKKNGGAGASAGRQSVGNGGGSGATGNSNYDGLKQELRDVHVVIRQNVEDLLTRGEKLETMGQYSATLKDQSNKYYKRTAHMNRMRVLKTYGPPIVVILVLLIFMWFYFF
ncbi:synaptobrevin vesicle transport protein, putative [Bodo saltans]|uniref:Synaptobrevin vesicle transport protein, putative n=1 Tax=Bodo saltans TaxID=75058 RepID=A0A0S4ITE2_BODSA|nr:synaptobrevin vesicle transport protein, putative [Bodo saltans]|eukprot:CUF73347.1 synaptobrevin vesicle transport protein, putative [Bodo saltans]